MSMIANRPSARAPFTPPPPPPPKVSQEGHLLPNVYHTTTFGGYLVYHLPKKCPSAPAPARRVREAARVGVTRALARRYKVFADPREYCFSHLDNVAPPTPHPRAALVARARSRRVFVCARAAVRAGVPEPRSAERGDPGPIRRPNLCGQDRRRAAAP
jgi:hypothetical protein